MNNTRKPTALELMRTLSDRDWIRFYLLLNFLGL